MTSVISKIWEKIKNIQPLKFIRNMIYELRDVDYLSRKKVLRYTLFIVSSLIIGILFLVVVDKILIDSRNLILQI